MTRLVAAALLLAGCSAMHTTHATPDEISIQYDTLVHSRAGAAERAASHCGQSGKRAVLVSSRAGGATFRCVSR